ncbi:MULTISPECIES: hypothetical protein [Prochlorococcus]|uniref:hypothetical protein n=1 Tax=Prochlorococcus TaxID=1218 RepID=UPI000533A553|nr:MULTISPECIES: hypothetical protein [Prochlorococcus]KGG11911.1 hypothetical protein EV05_1112 [Prochlorococcus sp. MIT 0601]
MSANREHVTLIDDMDSIDSYFECITACSLGDEGVECVTQCLEVHLKSEVD